MRSSDFIHGIPNKIKVAVNGSSEIDAKANKTHETLEKNKYVELNK